MNDERNIERGDRIFASIAYNGRAIAEMMMEGVENISEVLRRLRKATKSYRGLAILNIRNASRGWSIRKSVMLYPEILTGRNSPFRSDFATIGDSLSDSSCIIPNNSVTLRCNG